ncbi:AAA+ ATPase, partial [Helicosporidium sp. ATCC 50920]
ARVAESMRASLRAEYREAMGSYDEAGRSAWVLQRAQQTAVVASRTAFTREVHDAFDALEEGNEGALKDLFARQCAQLGRLVDLINGELAPAQRRRLITLCTVDVHARDVVQGLVAQRAESAQSFRWQSQLRYYQDAGTGDCRAAICDADVPYGYEFTGDSGCLCITPLTDRCYITLTQAQRLHLGGAPAGPAGTGKTETVKDLARALGQLCYVFNCSDQLDFRAMGQIYKGLAQTGAWGCFDEFNRIPVSVLSVCSTQYKAILDALRAKRTTFELDGELFPLKPSVMAFITMNPGYPGRAELPESLKALFRPVSMAAPDLELICEIMLMAEGFQQATTLAHKFITLYRLCESLLSQSRHYDWKLRAIKTTLYVAGGLKRANPSLTEEQVLCRALRDFNLGKLTSEDAGIFAGLLQDIFPGLPGTLPPSRSEVFERCIVSAAQELGLCPEEGFRLKVRQLREILAVRWSVFVLGAAGAGKSCVWRTLLRAQQLFGERSIARVVNPKAVSRNELYGQVSPQTRDWQEGVVSSIFRDMAQSTSHAHQWIVLDGDIDAEWIESMNTVMDDNRLLTLASNERIPLAPSMRLILEIDHMRHCSPATVTRGGVIHLNATDVGWRPPLDAWIAKLPAPELRPLMAALAEKYLAPAMERVGPKPGAPGVSAVGHIHALCRLLDAVLPAVGGSPAARREGGGSDAVPLREEDRASAAPAPPSQLAPAPGPDRRLTEHHFVWACVWAFGGALSGDARARFGEWWQTQFRSVPFPSEGSVYEYRVGAAGFERWPADEDGVAVAELGEGGGEANAGHSSDPASLTSSDASRLPLSDTPSHTHSSSALVLTRELAQLRHVARLLLLHGSNVLLVGPTASGKSALLGSLAASLQDRLAVKLAALHAEHDAASAQALLESALEKRAGSRYGAPRGRRALFVLDGLGLPAKDAYDTPCALELLRQAVEQGAW